MSITGRFFVVERDDLGKWGAEDGYATVEEANMALNQSRDVRGIVVIYGRDLPLAVRLEVEDGASEDRY